MNDLHRAEQNEIARAIAEADSGYELADAEERIREDPSLMLDMMPAEDVYELALSLLRTLWLLPSMKGETRDEYNARRLATMYERAEGSVSYYAEKML